jgi:hypothetical protein
MSDVTFKIDGRLYPVPEQEALELAQHAREQAGDDALSDAIAAAVYIEHAVEMAPSTELPYAEPEEKRYLRQALQAWGMTPEGYKSLPESLRRLRYALDAEAEAS